jgi:phytoene synthase
MDPEALIRGSADRQVLGSVVADLLSLADRYYRSADAGMRYIPWRARQAILVASRVYRAIGVRLRRNGCDVFAGRTVVPSHAKLLWTCRALAAGIQPHMLGFGARRPHDPALHASLPRLPGVA